MTNTTDAPMTGCLIEGHWGQYGVARVVQIAADYGYDDLFVIAWANSHLAAQGPSSVEPLTDKQFERLMEGSEEAELWLNENVAQPGHHFHWDDGEFYYTVIDDDRVEDPWP